MLMYTQTATATACRSILMFEVEDETLGTVTCPACRFVKPPIDVQSFLLIAAIYFV